MRLCKAKAVLSLLAAFVVLAVITPGCGGGEPTGVFKQTVGPDGGALSVGDEIVVRIPVGALASDARLTITPATEEDPPAAELDAAVSVGQGFRIDLGGQELSAPVVLEIAFDPDLLPKDSPQDAVFLAFYDEQKEEWVPVYGTVDLARHVVIVETDHLSWWNPFGWDLSELVDRIRRGLEKLLELTELPVADPTCSSPPEYTTWESTGALGACVEGVGVEGHGVLRAVNKRAYATLVHLPSGVQLLHPPRGSLTDAAWAFLSEKLAKDVVYIPPAGEAEFSLRFAGAGEVKLWSEPSDTTLALDMVLTIVSAMGADPENVVGSLECVFGSRASGGLELRFGDILDIAKECATVALSGTARTVYKLIKNLAGLVPATGQLLVERTAELFGTEHGQVKVTYSPPATQEPPPQEPPEEPSTGIPGIYVNPLNRSEYLELKEDGTFFFKAEALMGFLRGEWKEKGNGIILSYYYFGFQGHAEAKIQNNHITVVDEDGQVWTEAWVKEDVSRIGGDLSLSVGARYAVEVIDHCLVERGEDPRLHLEYQNIGDEPIRVKIGISWTDENGLFLEDGGQEDTRGPIPPGQVESLIYRPRSDLSPGEIANYYLQIWAEDWDTPGLPTMSVGPEVEPEEAYSR